MYSILSVVDIIGLTHSSPVHIDLSPLIISSHKIVPPYKKIHVPITKMQSQFNTICPHFLDQ
jgi:hypothetical protein